MSSRTKIPTNKLECREDDLHSAALEVEFYPSIDDYVHMASVMQSMVRVNSATTYAYYLFLFLNTIIFPAFLLISNYFLLGAIVFLTNLVAVLFLIPRINRQRNRQYYQMMYPDLENKLVKVTLTETGFHSVTDGAQSFLSWRRVTSIDETDESIYFYYVGSSFAIRKNGFAYREDSEQFVSFARTMLTESKHQLSQAV